jgi:hypothetical protein
MQETLSRKIYRDGFLRILILQICGENINV